MTAPPRGEWLLDEHEMTCQYCSHGTSYNCTGTSVMYCHNLVGTAPNDGLTHHGGQATKPCNEAWKTCEGKFFYRRVSMLQSNWDFGMNPPQPMQWRDNDGDIKSRDEDI